MNRVTGAVLLLFIAILLGSGLLAYVLSDEPRDGRAVAVPAASPAVATPTDQNAARQIPLFGQLFGPDATGLSPASFSSWEAMSARIALRFSLAAFLASLLAFRPRRGVSVSRRNPYVAQTQILMAVVAGAMMMVVGDSAARAFGIFAAASLVRFRTNIRDPKEITVLLISLALGLASGVGRWDLAIVLTVFSLIVLWILEWREPELVFRSMELKVTTTNVVATQKALRDVFRQHGFDKELRAVDREATEESPGSIVYSVDVSPTVSTDEISADILAIDGQNVQGIEWDQKKSYSYLYQ